MSAPLRTARDGTDENLHVQALIPFLKAVPL
jgi:hypothetical protein